MSYRPQFVSIETVNVERDGAYARITFKDGSAGSINIGIGPELAGMTDEDIIALHNQMVESQIESAQNWRPTEIEEGRAQIKFDRSFGAWSAEGHVLRCMVDSGEDEMPTIEIDGKTLSWTEFGKMLNPFAGWGMRVMFVSEDQLCNPPQPELRKSAKRIPKKLLDELASGPLINSCRQKL